MSEHNLSRAFRSRKLIWETHLQRRNRQGNQRLSYLYLTAGKIHPLLIQTCLGNNAERQENATVWLPLHIHRHIYIYTHSIYPETSAASLRTGTWMIHLGKQGWIHRHARGCSEHHNTVDLNIKPAESLKSSGQRFPAKPENGQIKMNSRWDCNFHYTPENQSLKGWKMGRKGCLLRVCPEGTTTGKSYLTL